MCVHGRFSNIQSHLIKASILSREYILSDDWKFAYITPIFKKENRRSALNMDVCKNNNNLKELHGPQAV